ncbi:camp-regulated phosphoprotein/endosulfine conserved region-domain-containing protein, partial [Kalaharituber pfeilii]
MLPSQKNKIDISTLSEDEQRIVRMYGKLPSKKELLNNKLKERKYFDSGDYALSKAGKASDVGVTNIGSKHPLPENIPHSHNPTGTPTTTSGSAGGPPTKESPLLHCKSPVAQEPTE